MERYYRQKYFDYRQQYSQSDNFIDKVKYKKYKAKYKEVRQAGGRDVAGAGRQTDTLLPPINQTTNPNY